MPDYLADDYADIARRMAELGLARARDGLRWGLWYADDWLYVREGRLRKCGLTGIAPTLFDSVKAADACLKGMNYSSGVAVKKYTGGDE